MATITLGNSGQPEAVHVGINALVCKFSLSVSYSAGDVYRIGKLPQGAIPLDAVWYPGAAAATGFVCKFGTSASQELFFASDSWAESGVLQYRQARKLGVSQQISLADDARVLYENVTAVPTAGTSIGYVGDLIVFYKMPGQTL